MIGPVVRQLIWKDWQLNRVSMLWSVAAGGMALGLLAIGGQDIGFVGIVTFFTALVVFSCLVPMWNIVNERKKQNLAFVMSLPVSSFQYSVAKLVSTIATYLAPWLMLVVAAVGLILTRGELPDGLIPLALVLSMLPLVGFSIIAATALISDSEGWSIAATIVCNSTYGLAWYFLARTQPDFLREAGSASPVWGGTALTLLGTQVAVIAAALVLTLYLQSRKRDFV